MTHVLTPTPPPRPASPPPGKRPPNPWLQNLRPLILLALATLLAYGNAFSVPFLLDDEFAINHAIHGFALPGYLKRGDVHAQFDRYAEAVADYTRAIERDANLADAWHNRAAAHAMLGNLPAARADLFQCRRLGSEPAPELVDMVGGLDPAP